MHTFLLISVERLSHVFCSTVGRRCQKRIRRRDCRDLEYPAWWLYDGKRDEGLGQAERRWIRIGQLKFCVLSFNRLTETKTGSRTIVGSSKHDQLTIYNARHAPTWRENVRTSEFVEYWLLRYFELSITPVSEFLSVFNCHLLQDELKFKLCELESISLNGSPASCWSSSKETANDDV